MTEWLSNFNVGTSGDHAGFSESAGYIKDRLDEYIYANYLSDYKIWMVGYSRGGAVVDPRLVEVLEVEHVHLRTLAASLPDALGIVGVVVPFSLAAGQHLLAPHLIAQVAVELTGFLVGISVNRILVYLCTHRSRQPHQHKEAKQFFHPISFRTTVRSPVYLLQRYEIKLKLYSPVRENLRGS